MRISEAGLALIRECEGLRLAAYPDPGSGREPWTIGYGTTVYPNGGSVRPGDTCTAAEAEAWLRYLLVGYENAVLQALTGPINQAMFDALVSFTYNVGIGNFRRSTLLRLINAGDYLGAAEEFDRWNLASGRTLRGLAVRRDKEQALFNAGLRQALAGQADMLAQFDRLQEGAA